VNASFKINDPEGVAFEYEVVKQASVGGLYPPFAVTPLAPCRIDLAARLRGLLDCRESGSFARRAFELGRLR
jgi:hypothetical protein